MSLFEVKNNENFTKTDEISSDNEEKKEQQQYINDSIGNTSNTKINDQRIMTNNDNAEESIIEAGREVEMRWEQLNKNKKRSKKKTITSLVRHKLKNNKTVYAIRQQCEQSDAKQMAHIVILTKSHIKNLRKDFTKFNAEFDTSDDTQEKNVSTISDTDEKGNSLSTSPPPTVLDQQQQSIEEFLDMHSYRVYKDEMINVYLKIIGRHIYDVRREMCTGCLERYPSQLDHYCMTVGMEQFLEHAFWNLLEKVDEEEANRICDQNLETHGRVYLSKINLLKDTNWIENLRMKILKFSILNTCIKHNF